MAKPPIDTYEKMLEFISKQLRSSKQANYQPVMIKMLLKNGGSAAKKEIASALQKANDPSQNTSYYLSVPVYRVLKDNGVVTESGIKNPEYVLILKNFTKEEFEDLISRLDSWINKADQFLKTGFKPFKEAKEFVRSLGLKNQKEWDDYVNSGKKPVDIPSSPSQFYKKKKYPSYLDSKLNYNKAIRDKIPEIIKESGYSCNVKTLTDGEFLVEIEKKLVEEVQEYQKDKEVNELADILEVIYRIAQLKGISKEELEGLRIKKVQDRGSFDKNLFLIDTTKHKNS